MIKSEDLRLGQPRVLETDNNLILPVNKWIRLLITGVNVIHSFGLHSLGLRFDGIPGRLNSVSFQFARLGFFRGACMEFCGILHAYMPIKILAVALVWCFYVWFWIDLSNKSSNILFFLISFIHTGSLVADTLLLLTDLSILDQTRTNSILFQTFNSNLRFYILTFDNLRWFNNYMYYKI